MQSLLVALSPAIGHDYFRALVAQLTKACAVDLAVLGRVVGDGERLASVAASHRGEPAPAVEFDLRGTPCEAVLRERFCHYSEGVAVHFHQDALLAAAGIDSYMGIGLYGADGAPRGVLALMHRGPMRDPARLELILRVVADRAAVELERTLANEALQQSEARLAAVLEGSPGVAVQWYDRHGRVLRWNRGSEAMFGFAAAEALGRTLDQLIHTPDEMAGFLVALADIERSGKPVGPAEYTFRRRDGSQGTCWSTIFPIPGDGGAPWFVCMDIDLTPQKDAEAARTRLEEQVRHAQKLESLGVLAGGVAHDFNNLLTSIRGNTSLLADLLDHGSRARGLVDEIEGVAQRATELTRQMLAYAGRGSFVQAPFCLATLVREMAKLLRAAVSSRVDFQLALESVVVEGDATQIRQVVMNLVTNAGEALPGSSGRIVVRTGCRSFTADDLQAAGLPTSLPVGEHAYLEVEDDGVGMDEDRRQRIFDPFFTTKFAGRGLGLAAVLGIVRGHGGCICVATTVGKGTRMTVVLPRSHAAASASSANWPDAPAAVAAPGRGGTVLVVDDEEDVRRVTRRLLERVGYDVAEVRDGHAAIAAVTTSPRTFVAALVDLTMPQQDGRDVARRLRVIAPCLPIVLMSGYAEVVVDTGALQGAEFVPKPFSGNELAVALERAIAGAPR